MRFLLTLFFRFEIDFETLSNNVDSYSQARRRKTFFETINNSIDNLEQGTLETNTERERYQKKLKKN